MNAVLLKELRQGVRNRYVLAAYIIFVVALLIVVGVMTSLALQEAAKHPLSIFGAGRDIFLTVHGIFAGVAIVFIPSYVAVRILRERWGANLDVMYVTPMPPSNLLVGKFLSALALVGLFLGGALPFLALSYFVGGIDVLNIVMSVLMTLCVVALLTLFVMLLSIAPVHKILRGLLLLGAAGGLCGATMGWIAATAGLCDMGYMSILGDTNSCIGFVEVVALAASMAGLVYAAALAGFRSVNVERMRPFRVLATALLTVWGIVTAIQSRNVDVNTFHHEINQPWVAILLILAVLMMIFGLSERVKSSGGLRASSKTTPPFGHPSTGGECRVKFPSRGGVPEGRGGFCPSMGGKFKSALATLWRVLGYPFRTGQLNAVCWAMLVLAVGIALSFSILIEKDVVTTHCTVCNKTHFLPPCQTTLGEGFRIFALNVSGYALTMLALWRYVLRRYKVPVSSLWWVTLLFIGLLTLILGVTIWDSDGITGINRWAGFLFAQNRSVLPWLYGWNAVMLLGLAPVFWGLTPLTTHTKN